MPDTFARMRQLIGTTTEWAVNDLVIGLGEIAVERAGAEFKVKIGDGSSRFSALPYASGAASTVAWGNITGKPSVFPPSSHNHPPEQITGLVDASGNIDMAVIPDTLKERLDWKGTHTPTTLQPYPATAAAGDTWGIAGPSFTFTTGTLAGKTTAEGDMIVYDSARWYLVSGGSSINPADYVKVADLRTVSTGPSEAGKVPQLNTSGRLDPSMINLPGGLNFRGTVDIRQPVPSSVNSGDYYLVAIGGTAHASWVGIAGQTMQVNDQVIWNGIQWSYIRPTGASSGFLPIDGSAPMTGALSLAAYTAGQPVAAHAVRKDYLDAAIAAVPTAEDSLGFLPLNPANNLSEVVNDATARSNLGLGSSATMPATAFVEKSLFLNANEMLIASGAGAVARLAAPTADGQVLSSAGGGISWQLGSGAYLLKEQNLADVPDKALARSNLGVPDLTEIILKSTVDAAGDLIVGTGPDTVARFARGADGKILRSTASGIAWGDGLGVTSEQVLTVAAATIAVNFPAGAKTVELYWETTTTVQSDFSMAIRALRGATLETSANYHLLRHTAYAVSAGGATLGGDWSVGSTAWLPCGGFQFRGKLTFTKPGSGMGVGQIANISSSGRQIFNDFFEMSGQTGIDGYTIYTNGVFAIGSYLRCVAF